ncbi:hypothetical protein [Methylocystis echinoides]|uniref:Uncharacterized protein n=1 Tax=Methylocystis echinoides TaxID=29468 RepID=A0A9W6GYP0_9HYPH|nr:hypothetical protein [Methylocystis echinoides]GLI95314.1 hypothetical protein LMG27198_43060 [Methylocystis echinoides]
MAKLAYMAFRKNHPDSTFLKRPEVAADLCRTARGLEWRRAVFTRRLGIDFILNLAGYTADHIAAEASR